MNKDLLKQKLLSIVPKEMLMATFGNSGRLTWKEGFNAARAEMIKNIENLDLEQLINSFAFDRNAVLDEALAIMKKEFTPNQQVNAGVTKTMNRVRSLKTAPQKENKTYLEFEITDKGFKMVDPAEKWTWTIMGSYPIEVESFIRTQFSLYAAKEVESVLKNREIEGMVSGNPEKWRFLTLDDLQKEVNKSIESARKEGYEEGKVDAIMGRAHLTEAHERWKSAGAQEERERIVKIIEKELEHREIVKDKILTLIQSHE